MLIVKYYLLIKSLHMIFVISWMAALLYLPRIFVYHCSAVSDSQQSETFKIMEKRLFFYILVPAMLGCAITGYLLGKYVYDFTGLWLYIKFLAGFLLIAFSLFLYYSYKQFRMNKNRLSAKAWRVINEIPTILMIIAVFVVIFKPL